MESGRELGARNHVGIARSHDSFYIDEEEVVCRRWAKTGVLGSDLETAMMKGGQLKILTALPVFVKINKKL